MVPHRDATLWLTFVEGPDAARSRFNADAGIIADEAIEGSLDHGGFGCE